MAVEGTKIKLSDFELVKKIGQGGFGAVYVCRKRDTKEVLALKVVPKSTIWKKNKVTQMKNERDVLATNLTTWMVQLAYSFQDRHYCYLAMEYCPGGDLRHLLSALGYLEEDESRLYMAEMILAVFSLHSLGYIHRDLKPDNFLVDSKGHLKLTDFGLSKDGLNSSVANRRHYSLASTTSLPDLHPPSSRPYVTPQHAHIRSRTNASVFNAVSTPLFEGKAEQEKVDPSQVAYSVVGSPHYMSPEVLSEKHGYGAEVDWWSLGCIFWELVTGSPPFVGETPQAVFDAIVDWKTTLPLAVEEAKESMSPECLDFILQFLCDPKERFGSSKRSTLSKLFSHPFFKDFPVESIFELEPPFVPQLRDECDTSYFETDENRPLEPDQSFLNADGELESNQNTHGLLFGETSSIQSSHSKLSRFVSPDSSSHHHHLAPHQTASIHPESTFTSGRTMSNAMQCPQTAPRRLTRHSRQATGSSDEDSTTMVTGTSYGALVGNGDMTGRGTGNAHISSFMGTSTSTQHSPSRSSNYGRFGMPKPRMNAYGQTLTPMRRILESPSRDIAGFTYQRKKPVKSSAHTVSAIIRLDFDAEVPLQYLQRSHSPASDSSPSTSSPSELTPHLDLTLLDISPKALVFGEEDQTQP